MNIADLRKALADMLDLWQNESLDSGDILKMAEEFVEVHGLPDFGPADSRAIPVEVLGLLETLDMQVITKEDIPALRKFLDSGAGGEEDAWETWEAYRDSIDFDARLIKLAGDPVYGDVQIPVIPVDDDEEDDEDEEDEEALDDEEEEEEEDEEEIVFVYEDEDGNLVDQEGNPLEDDEEYEYVLLDEEGEDIAAEEEKPKDA